LPLPGACSPLVAYYPRCDCVVVHFVYGALRCGCSTFFRCVHRC
jgi:hypothetical protein